jgi:ankyrin repeat protein
LDGHTPLHFAAEKNNVGIAARLLDHDANPNIPRRNGWMPIHSAVQKGCEEMLVLLEFRGAKIAAVTYEGYTAAWLASKKGLLEAASALLSMGRARQSHVGDESINDDFQSMLDSPGF